MTVLAAGSRYDFVLGGFGFLIDGDPRIGANPTLKTLFATLDTAVGSRSTLRFGIGTSGYTPGASRKYIPILLQADIAVANTADGMAMFETSNDVGLNSGSALTIVTGFGASSETDSQNFLHIAGQSDYLVYGHDFDVATGNFLSIFASGSTFRGSMRVYGYEVDV